MRHQELQVNLFEVPLPDKPFALQTRVLSQGENLNTSERLLKNANGDEKRAVLVAELQERGGYREELISARDLPPFLVQALLEHGLQSGLNRVGKEIEAAFTSFVAFDSKDTVATSEKFLELRKGVEFRSESISFDRRHTFAFYASLKIRLRFTMDLTDAKLSAAAIGKDVHIVETYGHRQMCLQSIDSKSGRATLQSDEDGNNVEVPISHVRVPASRPILAAYCQSIGKSHLTQQLIHQAQEASFRLTRSGNKDRGWLKSELEFVRSWLLHASSGGRLVFSIPNTTQDVYLSATPATARFYAQ